MAWAVIGVVVWLVGVVGFTAASIYTRGVLDDEDRLIALLWPAWGAMVLLVVMPLQVGTSLGESLHCLLHTPRQRSGASRAR